MVVLYVLVSHGDIYLVIGRGLVTFFRLVISSCHEECSYHTKENPFQRDYAITLERTLPKRVQSHWGEPCLRRLCKSPKVSIKDMQTKSVC